MPNSIEFTKCYIPIIDEVYQNASVSRTLTSSGRIVRSTHNAREIMIPKISVSGLGDYTRDQGYKTGNINLEYQTRQMNYDRGINITADVMDVAESERRVCGSSAGEEHVKAGRTADWRITRQNGNHLGSPQCFPCHRPSATRSCCMRYRAAFPAQPGARPRPTRR